MATGITLSSSSKKLRMYWNQVYPDGLDGQHHNPIGCFTDIHSHDQVPTLMTVLQSTTKKGASLTLTRNDLYATGAHLKKLESTLHWPVLFSRLTKSLAEFDVQSNENVSLDDSNPIIELLKCLQKLRLCSVIFSTFGFTTEEADLSKSPVGIVRLVVTMPGQLTKLEEAVTNFVQAFGVFPALAKIDDDAFPAGFVTFTDLPGYVKACVAANQGGLPETVLTALQALKQALIDHNEYLNSITLVLKEFHSFALVAMAMKATDESSDYWASFVKGIDPETGLFARETSRLTVFSGDAFNKIVGTLPGASKFERFDELAKLW